MSVVAMVLLIAVVVAAVYLLVAMFHKERPFYGAMAVFTLTGPGGVMSFVYLALAA